MTAVAEVLITKTGEWRNGRGNSERRRTYVSHQITEPKDFLLNNPPKEEMEKFGKIANLDELLNLAMKDSFKMTTMERKNRFPEF